MDIAIAKTFVAAAETGSFLAAAARVHASPSAVTERIKQLEHLLAAKLFERDRRGCRLTVAGEKFLEPAQAMIRAWEAGCSRVALPSHFQHLVRLGGQHALWPELLIPLVSKLVQTRPDIAIRATAAAPAQLNRAMADEELDIAFLYDPIRRRGIRIEELASDRLVLVTSRPDRNWQDIFVSFDWGERAGVEIRSRLDYLPMSGLELELGFLSLDWLTATGGAGFVPERMAARHFSDGSLTRVPGSPSVTFSRYVCWRQSFDRGLAEHILAMAQFHMQNHIAP